MPSHYRIQESAACSAKLMRLADQDHTNVLCHKNTFDQSAPPEPACHLADTVAQVRMSLTGRISAKQAERFTCTHKSVLCAPLERSVMLLHMLQST